MSRTMNLLLVVVLLLALALNSLPLPAHAMTPSAYIQWFHQFGATTSRPENDSTSAVAVSGDYLYVVGYKHDSGGGAVANLYKYDINGNQLWSRQFGSLVTYAWGVTVDSSGVYVVGETYEALSGQTHLGSGDAYIRKYDVDGNELWTRLFGSSTGDSASEIAVDNSGVYVVGETWGTLPGQTSAGGPDAYIRKYDINGNELWTRQFGFVLLDYTSGVAVDNSGVYVVGGTRDTGPGPDDAYIRKYDVNGNELWTSRFGSSAWDGASAVVADGSSVYVVGGTNGTLSDQTNTGDTDAYIRRYDTAGSEVWTRQFGSSFADHAYAVTVDGSGIYVAGPTDGTLPGQASSGDKDAYIRKYDTSGNELWTHQFGSSSSESAYGIAVDNTETYMVGATRGTLPGQTSFGLVDAFIRKYDTSGNELWTRQFGGVITNSFYQDSANAVAVSDGVYVVGDTGAPLPDQTSAGSLDAYLRKYGMDGSENWIRQFGTSEEDGATSVAASGSDIYVVGNTRGAFPQQTNAGGQDVYIRKYDGAGTEVWTYQFGSPSDDGSNGVATDSSGVYIAGRTQGTLPGQTSTGQTDAFIRKYDFNGNETWTRQFGTTYWTGIEGITAGDSAIYVVGATSGTLPGQTSAGEDDAFVRKYGADGNEIWTRQFGSSLPDKAIDIATDGVAIYVLGELNRPIMGYPMNIVRKYDTDGNEIWTQEFGLPEGYARLGQSRVRRIGVGERKRDSRHPKQRVNGDS
jgi:hypothetical protein